MLNFGQSVKNCENCGDQWVNNKKVSGSGMFVYGCNEMNITGNSFINNNASIVADPGEIELLFL